MSDLRLITVQDDGEVTFTPERMYVPLTDLEEAVQRLTICLMNSAGTMVDDPAWGGNAMTLYLKPRKPRITDTKKLVEEVVHATQESLERSEPSGPYQIVNLNLVDVVLKERGYNIVIRVDFAEAISQTLSVPGRTDVVS